MGSIFEMLCGLGVAGKSTQELLSDKTRDRGDVCVYRDSRSGVIYIDGFYGGDEVYEDGGYRKSIVSSVGSRDYEVVSDAQRRLAAYRPLISGRKVVEFGCGDGAFLQLARKEMVSCCGVELQQDYVDALNEEGITCFKSLIEIEDQSQDTVASFHVLEHLPEPLPVLSEVSRVLKPGGSLVIEVPHANDFLLRDLKSEAFKSFTLWSQHLVLHTRESLRRMLAAAGFDELVIEGVQRYPLSNHLTWLSSGVPGGHKSPLSALDTPELKAAYESALNRIDATDTLVAIARKSR